MRSERSYLSTAAGVRQSVADVAAELLRAGVGPTARTRIASACCEIADNVRRHAYPAGEGRFFVSLRLDRRSLSVELRDEGIGFDAARALVPGRAPEDEGSGLARAAALSEGLSIERDARGSRVRLDFELPGRPFAEDLSLELSERDWLDPESARLALHMARSGEWSQDEPLSPAMAVAIGRLLAGRSIDQAVRSILWSRG